MAGVGAAAHLHSGSMHSHARYMFHAQLGWGGATGGVNAHVPELCVVCSRILEGGLAPGAQGQLLHAAVSWAWYAAEGLGGWGLAPGAQGQLLHAAVSWAWYAFCLHVAGGFRVRHARPTGYGTVSSSFPAGTAHTDYTEGCWSCTDRPSRSALCPEPYSAAWPTGESMASFSPHTCAVQTD